MFQSRLLSAIVIAMLLAPAGATPAADDVPAVTGSQAETAIAHAEMLSDAFRAVSREIAPAVVQVTGFARIDAMPEDEVHRLFGGRVPRRSRMGDGSGVLVSADGYLVTNHHVTAGADEIEVRTRDGREYTAALIGTDAESDLAVLRITGVGFPYARFGDSAVVEPGQWVLAIGNPYGFDHTITAGIVSAVRRSNVGVADYENFIQTDAAINPGNSGGPLLNPRGEIVGINTAISTRTGGYSGLGFAIPSNMVRSVFESIRDKGRVIRGWLGVQIQPLTPGLADSFGFQGAGVLIADVLADGPAIRAGMQPGDIVTRVGNRPVEATADLLNAVAETPPGSRTPIRIFRDGAFDEIAVELGERQVRSLPASPAGRPEPPAVIEPQSLGLGVRTLTPEIAAEAGLGDIRGVVVVDVADGSIAARSGLFPGDVIVRVGEREVVDADAFAHIMDDLDLESSVRLLVWTPRGNGRHRFVLLQGGA